MPLQSNAIELSRRTTLKTLIGGVVGGRTLPALVDGATTVTTTTSDWPTFQYDAANSGFHPDTTGPKEDVGIRWKQTLTETGNWVLREGPAIANETIYVGDSSQNVYALDRASGEQQWKFETTGSMASTPAVVDERVFFATEGEFHALDASTGNELWSFDYGVAGLQFNSPTVADDRVFFANGTGGTLFALDAETGTEQWRFETPDASTSTPAVVDDTVYFASYDDNLYALDASTGTEIWSYETEGNVSTPAVADGVVYAGGGDSMYAIRSDVGTQEWKSSTDDSVVASPAVADGVVYVGSYDTNVYAFDARNGDELWRFATDDTVYAPVAIADSVVYVASLDGRVYAIDSEQGTERWRLHTGQPIYSSPVVVDGTVYLGNDSGDLYAIAEGFPENRIDWNGRGRSHAKLACPADEEGYWHWSLARGGSTPLQDGAELTVTFADGQSQSVDGYFHGTGRGAVHFEVIRSGGGTVDSATATFDGGGDHPLLVLNHGTCLGPDEDPPAVIPEREETADELDYWQVDFGEGANPPIPPHYWPDDGMWALGNAEDGVTQNISGDRQRTDGQLADVDIVGGEFDFDDEDEPESVTVTFEIDDDGAPRYLHLALFAMPGPFEMDEIDDQVLINAISDEFEGGEEGELTIPLQ